MTSPDDLPTKLSNTQLYDVEPDKGILRIRSRDTGSEYILEFFESSAQIRQAVWFDCYDLIKDDLDNLYVLCSLMNERFSGCKSFIDKWGVVITASDIVGPDISGEHVLEMLGQVEFISLAMLTLVEKVLTERRNVTEAEIDIALDTPILQ